jgi:hypothetical protein
MKQQMTTVKGSSESFRKENVEEHRTNLLSVHGTGVMLPNLQYPWMLLKETRRPRNLSSELEEATVSTRCLMFWFGTASEGRKPL